ncbi:MAG: FxLYD domain-containing protein [Chloroflexota bacterium]|nr:FxLYD domain-containing protein [Chloroflexota bacterium]
MKAANVTVRLPIITPGPTATPAPATPRPTATPAPTPTPVIHIISEGDNLWDLSRKYDVSVSAIQEANAILDPRRLQLGQELVIPQPKPEEQAIPTPTPLAYDVQGLTFYRTPVGSLWCLGEVWNTTGTMLEEVQVQVTLSDERGRTVAAGKGVPALDAVAPGQRVPFAFPFRDPPQSFARYQAQPLRGRAALPGGHRYTHLTVVEDRGREQGDHFLVEGQVRNIGSAAATVRLAATAYDSQGDVIGARSLSLPDPLAPGAQSPFSITLLPVSQPPSSYAVQVQGLEVEGK